MKKKILAGILCGAVVLSLAGCGSKDKVSGSSSETSASETAASDNTSDNAASDASSSDAASDTTASETAAPVADYSDDENINQYSAFAVRSESLHDGHWDDENSNAGSNKSLSPDLSWDPVEGASCYVVYMVDVSANYFLHWKQDNITEPKVAEGFSDRRHYVGPYPPKGSTHNYVVYVIALKNPVEKIQGSLRDGCPQIGDFIKALDTDKDGNTGNILGAGKISGLFKD